MDPAQRKRAVAAQTSPVSPAQASSQAPALSQSTESAPSSDSHTSALTQRPTWSLLPTPAERFRGWIASHESEDAACDALCTFLVEQQSSLLSFCQTNGFAYATVVRWIDAAPDRSRNYAHAREARADVFAEQTIEISDEVHLRRVVDPETGEVTEVTFDAAAVAQARLRVDSRKWLAGKMNNRYADRTTVAVGGDPDAPPVNLSHTVTFVAAQAAAPAALVEEVPAFPKLEGAS
jgi:hypothetical protein